MYLAGGGERLIVQHDDEFINDMYPGTGNQSQRQ